MLLGLREGLVLTEQAMLKLRLFLESIRGGAARSKVLEIFRERMVERDFNPGVFAEYMLRQGKNLILHQQWHDRGLDSLQVASRNRRRNSSR
uniref:3-hydroxyisobutyrate dehydrogenase-like NAD-binding domain-containing protein n=1 Tax=Nelumbo nucifera TaxID=4432 RepID=A0A822Y877_NELNU|nr:TPA_asm: hypothetical protein HUJ06_029239 [Nelumbo nucifera]